MEMDFLAVLPFAGDFFMEILSSVLPIFAALAVVDYMFQRRQYEQRLRMSKQEVKEEYKQTEGDPQIKGQIRAKQRQMAQSRMMSAVPEADVIVRNPTHYAVALKYDADKGHAPRVIAKGADLIALRIIKLAEESGVKCIENRPLARSLYETVPLDSEIPGEFYAAVAEVLAYVYSISGKTLAAH
jgi:flagellar biosynthetic protein FlhB